MVESSEEIEPLVVGKLRASIKQCFWTVYRFDDDTLDMAGWVWSDDDLATLWGAHLNRERVFELRPKPWRGVGEDWRMFYKVEGM